MGVLISAWGSLKRIPDTMCSAEELGQRLVPTACVEITIEQLSIVAVLYERGVW